MLRFIIAGLWTVFFLILSLPLILVTWIIGFFSPRCKSRISHFVISNAFKVLLKLAGVKIDFVSSENVPTDCPVLYCPNHRSIFDIIMTYTKVPGPTGYVAKKETRKVPIFNIWMNFIHCQFLDRSDLRQGLKVILNCCELIKSGISVCIFPEGTRNKSEATLLPFHDGSFKIAEKTGCPIVPVAIVNSAEIFENHLPKLKPVHVIIEYCKPIYTKDMDRAQMKGLSEQVYKIIEETYNRNLSKI